MHSARRAKLMADRKLVHLRRTIAPYVGQTVILAGVTVYLTYVSHARSDWRGMWALAIIWPLYAFSTLYFGLKYRVLWDETGLVMRASGLAERRIELDEITGISSEFADVTELLAQSRPFRRIVVHGRKHDPKAFVDISLRHFRLDDIEELLATIRTRRPDLHVPTVPMNRRIWQRN